MWVAERVREFALLRIAGAPRRQVLRMLRIEALSVVLLAAALALVATALPGRAALQVRKRPSGCSLAVVTRPCPHKSRLPRDAPFPDSPRARAPHAKCAFREGFACLVRE